MANVKLRNNATGEIIEKSEMNWKNLSPDRKAKYTVVDGGELIVAKTTKTFTPPELNNNQSEGEQNKETVPVEKEETQEQKIIRLHKEGMSNSEIGKAVGAHFKTVEKILKNAK